MTHSHNKYTVLTHISDFHLPIEGAIPSHKLLSKRFLGYANLRLNRGKTHKKEPFQKLLTHLSNLPHDMCVATGDFVNLALSTEFAHLAELFREAGFNENNLFCIPGNHDRYTPGAQFRKDFEMNFRQWIPFEGSEMRYPTYKRIGNVALVGLNTATWRGPIRAAGRIENAQLKRLESLLRNLEASLHLVIAMHHPPFHISGHQFKQYLDGLQNYKSLISLLQGRNATVLHGHIHVLSYRMVGDIRVVGVPSASNDARTDKRQLAYNTLTFGNQGLQEITSTRYWPASGTFETFSLNEKSVDL